MRTRVDRWWLGCLLVAFGVVLCTAHAAAPPHHDSGAPHVHAAPPELAGTGPAPPAAETAPRPELVHTDAGPPAAETAPPTEMARTDRGLPVAEAEPPAAPSPEVARTDRGLPVAEHECCGDAGDHQMARQRGVHAAPDGPHAAVAQLPPAGQPAEPLGSAPRGVERALLQVWRN